METKVWWSLKKTKKNKNMYPAFLQTEIVQCLHLVVNWAMHSEDCLQRPTYSSRLQYLCFLFYEKKKMLWFYVSTLIYAQA